MNQNHLETAAPASLPGRTLSVVAMVCAPLSGLIALLLLLVAHSALPASINPALPAALTVGAIVATATALLRPRWIFLGFLVACMVVPWALESISIPLGFMKLYIQDVVFAFNATLILWLALLRRISWPALPFNRYIMLHFSMGVVAVGIGFVHSHNEFDNVLGDFRRSFFYFMNYFVALLLLNSVAGWRALLKALLVGSAGCIVRGIYELAAGKFTYRRIGDAAHLLTHFEIIFLLFGAYYALVQILFNPNARKLLWSIFLGGAVLVVLVGNFRACWLSFAGGLLFMFFYLPRRQKALLFALSCAMALFVAVLIGSLWDVQVVEGRSTLGEEFQQKMNIKETRADVNVIWRFESYANALRQWQSSPYIGTGLGENLEFIATTSTGGAMMTEGHRVHNSFIWLLMSLGVLGFSIFLFIQWQYLRFILRYLKHTQWLEGRLVVMACGTFYFAFMTATNFEIFFESAMPITVLSSTMALAMLTIHLTPQQALDIPTSSR